MGCRLPLIAFGLLQGCPSRCWPCSPYQSPLKPDSPPHGGYGVFSSSAIVAKTQFFWLRIDSIHIRSVSKINANTQ